jgi:hypothetical protein
MQLHQWPVRPSVVFLPIVLSSTPTITAQKGKARGCKPFLDFARLAA